jgi:hypothetical protein
MKLQIVSTLEAHNPENKTASKIEKAYRKLTRLPAFLGSLSSRKAQTSVTALPARVDEPQTLAQIKKITDADGWIDITLPVSAEDLVSCGGIEGLSELFDERIFTEGATLADFSYETIGVDKRPNDEGVVLLRVQGEVSYFQGEESEQAG